MIKNITGGVAVLIKDDKHFLIKQSKNKPLGGEWRHPGGSFLDKETPVEGVKREILEEIGLEIEVAESVPWHIEKIDYKPGYFSFYRAKVIGGKLKIDINEIDDYGWFALDEIKKLPLMKATKSFYNSKF